MSKLEFTRGEIIASKYEVVDVLDESPLGFTHRVKHQKSGKFVRLTLLRPKIAGREHKDRLLEVYKKIKDLQHPSIIRIGELGEHDGVAYITTEDFEGQTLRELLTEYKVSNQQFELTEAAQIAIQILEAIEALHELGFIIRGLRPEYILINARRAGPRGKNFVAKVKILGSGFWDLVPTATLAEDEFARAEAQYLAPEMKSFEPTATVRADNYSAGVIFYELLTGVAPVSTYQMPATVRPGLPKSVNTIVELALAQSPDDRYQTTADFKNSIQRVISEADVESGDEQPRLITPLSVGLGLVLFALVGVLLWSMRTTEEGELQARMADDINARNGVSGQTKMPPPEALSALLKLHPPNMAYIPEGPYLAGRMHNDPQGLPSEPLAEVRQRKAFLIDRFEYPNGLGAIPASGVSYEQAEKACTEQGKRLCSADEWEKACKGPLNAIYAYKRSEPADIFDVEFCGDGLADRGYPSGSKDQCANAYGVYDMSGNYREWTSSFPKGKETRRIVKGGLKDNAERGTRCGYMQDENSSFSDGTMSFRCCRDVDAPPWTPPAAP